jgi:hypothetical protein
MTTLKFTGVRKMPRAIVLGGAALALLGGARPAVAQISVSPVIVQIAVEALAVNRTISVTNSGKAPVSVQFYAGDFDQEDRGENLFAELGTLPNSCAERIRVYPDGASLLPGETQSVRVDMEPGTQSCWSAVFVETTGVTTDGTLVRQRIAAKVYGVRPDARVEGEVIRMAIEKGDNGRKLAVTFRNLGDAPLRPEGSLEIRSFTGEVAAKVTIEAFSVLPGRDRSVEILMPDVGSAGEYVAVPVLDFGGAYLAGGQVAFEVGASEVKLAAKLPATEQRDR